MTYRDDLIRSAKAAQKKTNEDIAQEAQLATATVSAICNGKEDILLSSLVKVAQVLNLQLSELFQTEKVA